jgi:predicted nucleic acid-binding protein
VTDVLCDTSVLVASLIGDHSHHGETFPLIKRILKGDLKGSISAHTLAETFSVLTSYPGNPPLSLLQARQTLYEKVKKIFKIVPLTAVDYELATDLCIERNLRGGVIYDALIGQSAIKVKAKALVTWNLKHFERFKIPSLRVCTPTSL